MYSIIKRFAASFGTFGASLSKFACFIAVALLFVSCDKTVGALPYIEPDPNHGISEDEDNTISYTRKAPLTYTFSAHLGNMMPSSTTYTWEISDPGLDELYSTISDNYAFFTYTFHAEGEAKVTFYTMKVDGIDGYVKDHALSITLHVY